MKLDQQLIKVLHAMCSDIATPRADLVKDLSAKGDWAELQNLRCNPADYPCPESYFKDAVVTDFLRKCELPGDEEKLEAGAVRTFWECETQCAKTNATLNHFLPDNLHLVGFADLHTHSFLEHCKKVISNVLGRVPDDLTPRFGKGATMSDAVPLTTLPDKVSKIPTVTSQAQFLEPLWSDTAWARGLYNRRVASGLQVIRGNGFFTVPKDAVKRRGCCKEPSFNIAYQLAVGRLMKHKLKAQGIDLKEGQDTHRKLAQKASLDGTLSTIDLSNASDTLARVVVRLLLPDDWFQLLDSLRSPMTRIKGKWVRLEKFSSMGNGFTFELETLIFYSLARTLCELRGEDYSMVKVYGDDIIVPTCLTEDMLAALKLCGFTPNRSKTFTSGPFRESCGGDFYAGVPVRAHYVETLPTTPADWISLANGLKRLCLDDRRDDNRWKYLSRAWRLCLRAIPSDIRRCRGPRHLGDVVIHDDDYHTTVDPNGTPFVRAWIPIPVVLPWAHWTPEAQLATALLGLGSEGVTPRGAVSGWRFGKIPAWGIPSLLIE